MNDKNAFFYHHENRAQLVTIVHAKQRAFKKNWKILETIWLYGYREQQ